MLTKKMLPLLLLLTSTLLQLSASISTQLDDDRTTQRIRLEDLEVEVDPRQLQQLQHLRALQRQQHIPVRFPGDFKLTTLPPPPELPTHYNNNDFKQISQQRPSVQGVQPVKQTYATEEEDEEIQQRQLNHQQQQQFTRPAQNIRFGQRLRPAAGSIDDMRASNSLESSYSQLSDGYRRLNHKQGGQQQQQQQSTVLLVPPFDSDDDEESGNEISNSDERQHSLNNVAAYLRTAAHQQQQRQKQQQQQQQQQPQIVTFVPNEPATPTNDEATALLYAPAGVQYFTGNDIDEPPLPTTAALSNLFGLRYPIEQGFSLPRRPALRPAFLLPAPTRSTLSPILPFGQSKQFSFAPAPREPGELPPNAAVIPYPPSFISITTRRPLNEYIPPTTGRGLQAARNFKPSPLDPVPDFFANRQVNSLLDSYIPSWVISRMLQQQQHQQQPQQQLPLPTRANFVPSAYANGAPFGSRQFKRNYKQHAQKRVDKNVESFGQPVTKLGKIVDKQKSVKDLEVLTATD